MFAHLPRSKDAVTHSAVSDCSDFKSAESSLGTVQEDSHGCLLKIILNVFWNVLNNKGAFHNMI